MMKNRKPTIVIAILSVVFLCSNGMTASAQETEETYKLEPITVTAQKKKKMFKLIKAIIMHTLMLIK